MHPADAVQARSAGAAQSVHTCVVTGRPPVSSVAPMPAPRRSPLRKATRCSGVMITRDQNQCLLQEGGDAGVGGTAPGVCCGKLRRRDTAAAIMSHAHVSTPYSCGLVQHV